MQLDHVFVFAAEPERTVAALRARGLVETYRRSHPGQGTANACFCFENAYLEILWVTDAEECASAPIARTRLLERSRWASLGTCPIGIAWRAPTRDATDIPVWHYAPPYLPSGVTIRVAVESDDPHGPMLFQSPGDAAPADWPEARRGTLQRTAGFGAIEAVVVRHPPNATPGAALRAIAASTRVTLEPNDREAWSLALRVGTSSGAGAFIEVL